jgi:hypothetical protein
MNDNNLLDAALYYAKHRWWYVLPLHTPTKDGKCSCNRDCGRNIGKHPRTLHGLKDATRDEKTIRLWWEKWPDANVGIRTGRESGLAVLDEDPRNGSEKSIEALEKTYGPLERTETKKTGGGGRHRYYRIGTFDHLGKYTPASCPSREVAPGIDLKGDGGYVVAPPSLHASGNRYENTNEDKGRGLYSIPEWLAKPQNGAQRAAAPVGDVIPEGSRNDTLASIAGTMRRRGLGEDTILAALLAENEKCSPPLERAEVEKIAHSIARYEPASIHEAAGMRIDVSGVRATPTRTSATLTVTAGDTTIRGIRAGDSMRATAEAARAIRARLPEPKPEKEAIEDAVREAIAAAAAGGEREDNLVATTEKYLMRTFDFRFRRGRAIFSEAHGECYYATDIRSHTPTALLADLSAGGEKIPHGRAAKLLQEAHSNIHERLPPEAGETGLGPDSKAGRQLAAKIRQTLTTLSTTSNLLRARNDISRPHVQPSQPWRDNLIGRAFTFFKRGGDLDTQNWLRVQRGFACWAAVSKRGRLRVAITLDLFEQGPRPIKLPDLSNADLLALAQRYGLAATDGDHPPTKGAWLVLTNEMIDELARDYEEELRE